MAFSLAMLSSPLMEIVDNICRNLVKMLFFKGFPHFFSPPGRHIVKGHKPRLDTLDIQVNHSLHPQRFPRVQEGLA